MTRACDQDGGLFFLNDCVCMQMLSPTYKSRSEDFRKTFKDIPKDERLIVGEQNICHTFTLNLILEFYFSLGRFIYSLRGCCFRSISLDSGITIPACNKFKGAYIGMCPFVQIIIIFCRSEPQYSNFCDQNCKSCGSPSLFGASCEKIGQLFLW